MRIWLLPVHLKALSIIPRLFLHYTDWFIISLQTEFIQIQAIIYCIYSIQSFSSNYKLLSFTLQFQSERDKYDFIHWSEEICIGLIERLATQARSSILFDIHCEFPAAQLPCYSSLIGAATVFN